MQEEVAGLSDEGLMTTTSYEEKKSLMRKLTPSEALAENHSHSIEEGNGFML